MKRANIEFSLEGEFASLRFIFLSLFILPVLYILVVSAGVLAAQSVRQGDESQDSLTALIGVAILISVIAPQLRGYLLKSKTKLTLDADYAKSVFDRYRIAVIVSLIAWDAVATIGLVAASLYGAETISYSLSTLSLIWMFFARPKEAELKSMTT